MKKINPYIIVIVVLLLVIVGFAYNQWGDRTLKLLGAGNEAKVLKDDIIIGNKDAPVTIVEYYSYLCGYCKQFEDETKPKILANYITTGKAKLILRPFSIFGEEDAKIDETVFCANEQGKFLEYHDYLFNNVENMQKIDDVKIFAKNTGMNEDEFNQCFDTAKYKAKIEQLYKQGNDDFKKANVATNKIGTPAFFIDGEALIGAQSYELFVEIIEKKLND